MNLELNFINFFRKNVLYTKDPICARYKMLNAGKKNLCTFHYLIIKISKYSSNIIYICCY